MILRQNFGGKGSDGIAKCISYEASARAIEVC
jgi:hypothetical protein